MFTDESLEPVSIESHIKKEVYIRDQLCQTREVREESRACQTVKRRHVDVQTDPVGELPSATRMCVDNSRNLVNFMLRMEPVMCEQLLANSRSRCFDGYEVQWDENTESEEISVIHELKNVENTELKVTAVAWNSTGSVIAASLGFFEHESWCIHQSFIYVWNIDKAKMDEEKPQKTIDCDSCLLDIAFHPRQPALLAGGNFSGKILIWDVSLEDNSLIAYSGKDTVSHKEPVSKVRWRVSSKLATHELVSVGYDGYILIWEYNQSAKELQLVTRFLLLGGQIGRNIKKPGKTNDLEMGISCIDLNISEQDSLYVGCENGGIFKCQLEPAKARKIQNRENENCLVPRTKMFNGHVAGVTSIKLSPLLEDMFLSCGSDMMVHIYTTQQTSPLMKLDPVSNYLTSAQFSLTRPTVLYVTTSNGKLMLIDLTMNSVAPVLDLRVQDKLSVNCVMCNTVQRNLIATGDSAGVVKLWKLPPKLTVEKSGEKSYFEVMKDYD